MDYLWLFISLVVIHSAVCQKIIPEESEIVVPINSEDASLNFTLTCSDTESITWIYHKYKNTIYTLDYNHTGDMHVLTLKVSNISYMDTGSYVCKRLSPKNENNGTEIYVYVFDGEHYLTIENEYLVLQTSENKSLIIPCKPTLPNTTVKLQNEEDDSEMTLEYDQKRGFFLNNPKVKDSKTVVCSALNNASETVETARVVIRISTPDPAAKPIIELSGTGIAIEGKPLSMNCSVRLKVGSYVYLNWKYPNEGVKNRTQELDQQEVVHHGLKTNYRILTFFNLSKSDTGYYTCACEDVHTNTSEAKRSYYLNVFDSSESFLEFKILADSATNHIQNAGYPELKFIFNVTSHPAAAVSCETPKGFVINLDEPSASSSSSKYQLYTVNKLIKFTILHLEIDDSGTYKCTADNGAGKKETVNISIYIRDKPTVQLSKTNESILANELSVVECSVIGYPRPTISWFAQECNNYPSSCEYKRSELSSSLFTAENDQGKPHVLKSTLRYRANETTVLSCTASNSMGSNGSSIPFIVTDVKDGFSAWMPSSEITVDDNVTLTCQASRYIYKNSIRWDLSTDDGKSYQRVESVAGVHILPSETKLSYKSILNIPSIQKSHRGWYKCHAESLKNESKDEWVHVTTVNDVEKPVFTNLTNLNDSSSTINANRGKHEFRCVASGVPKPTLTWYKDKKPFVIRKNESESLSLSSDNQTLTIKFPQEEYSGQYKCVATNKGGNVESKGTLTIKGISEEHRSQFYYIVLPALLTISLTTCIAWILVKMQKMKKLKKKLAEDGLLNFEAGAVNSLNPELGIEEQADALPYDKRWEFPREKLKLGKQLGAGAFGVVLKAEADGIIDPNTSTTVAVKMVKRNVDALYIRALASELKIMIHLGRHLNVVNLLGACTRDINKRELVVIVEYCKFGNLHDFLLKQRGNFINQINDNGQLDFSILEVENKNCIRHSMSGAVENTSFTGTTTVESVTAEETLIGSDGYLVNKDAEPDWRSNYRGDYRNTTVRPIKTSDLLCWSFQIARGMEYLASRKVLHGDLAARNVLLADDNIVKICDFGLAKSMYASDNYKRKKNELLPVRWMAVESIRDRVFSIQSDVWSFGITMWELFSLSVTPYPGVEHLEALYTKLESGYRLEKPTRATKEIHEIMLDCWHERPTMRPLFTELSERIGALLESGVRSHYTNLNEVYLQMNANTCNGVDYLSLLNPPVYTTALEEPRYVNLPSIPSRESPEPEEDVELKPMLNTSDNYVNAKPLLFSNPNYMEINRPTYVNSAN